MRPALVVGIDEYPDAPLTGCVNDARRVSQLLCVNHDDNPNFEVRTITNPADLGRALLRHLLQELFSRTADLSLFYFSGHGYSDSTRSVLVTPDCESYDEGISMEEVLGMANSSPARERMIILDCCFSGSIGEVPSLADRTSVIKEGVSIMTASRRNETAVERSGAGVFTTLFCDGLDGGAADVLGNVKLGNLYAYIDEALGAWDQRPCFKTNVTKLAVLRRCAPAVSPEQLRRLTEYFDNENDSFALDPSFEPDAEPQNPQNQEVFSELQKLRAARLIEPIGADHMYYAAMNCLTCRLTPLGRKYWRLVNRGSL